MSILSSIRFGGRRLNGNESRNFDGSSKILIFNVNPNLCYFDLKKRTKLLYLPLKTCSNIPKTKKKDIERKHAKTRNVLIGSTLDTFSRFLSFHFISFSKQIDVNSRIIIKNRAATNKARIGGGRRT